MRCLLVEDERQVRESMAELLPWQRLGFSAPLTASNGLEALKILEEEQVDLIISDVRMPRMNGVDLLKTLRDRGIKTPFLFISGFSDKEYLMAAIRYHAVDYLEKPVMIPELVERIRSLAEEMRAPKNWVAAHELLAPDATLPPLFADARRFYVAVLLLAADGLRLTSQQIDMAVRAFHRETILEEESAERSLLIVAEGEEKLDFQTLVEALNRAGGGYSLCVSNPVENLADLPAAYRQADSITARSYLHPLRGLQLAGAQADCSALERRAVGEIRALRERRLYPLLPGLVCSAMDDLLWQESVGRKEALGLMRAIVREMGADEAGLDEYAGFEEAARELLVRVRACTSKMLETEINPAVGRVIAYIYDHISEALSVPELAQVAYVSSSHLSFLFKQSISMSVKQYITEMRMEIAKHLLERDGGLQFAK